MVYLKHLGAWCQTGEIAFILESGEIIQTSRSCPVPSDPPPTGTTTKPLSPISQDENITKQQEARNQQTTADDGL